MGKLGDGRKKQLQKKPAVKMTAMEKKMAAEQRASSQKYQRGDDQSLKASLKVRILRCVTFYLSVARLMSLSLAHTTRTTGCHRQKDEEQDQENGDNLRGGCP